MLIAIILLALFLSLVFYLIIIYNNLISLKSNVARNWSNIDVLLKQRYSELPKLIDACKEYMKYEQNTFEKIVTARKTAINATETKNLAALSQAESALKTGLTQLFALAENYPDLKTNQSFLQIQGRITDLENDIADRRELYNDSVNLNNIRIQQIPDIFVARAFHFAPFDLLTFSKSETEDVNIKENFND